MTVDRTRANGALLAAQAVWFGVTSALLVIPANGIFLAAYGAEWLPLTYVGIALLGTARLDRDRPLAAPLDPADGLRRRARRDRRDAAGTWAVIAVTGSAWPSVVQLIMFPILLQLGFVIIGGQAGRLLDLQQIKRYFPRDRRRLRRRLHDRWLRRACRCSTCSGAPEHLVVVSAASCVVFAAPRPGHRAATAGRADRRRPTDRRPSPGRRCARCSRRGSSCSCSSIRCCRRWAARSSTSWCSTGPRPATTTRPS